MIIYDNMLEHTALVFSRLAVENINYALISLYFLLDNVNCTLIHAIAQACAPIKAACTPPAGVSLLLPKAVRYSSIVFLCHIVVVILYLINFAPFLVVEGNCLGVLIHRVSYRSKAVHPLFPLTPFSMPCATWILPCRQNCSAGAQRISGSSCQRRRVRILCPPACCFISVCVRLPKIFLGSTPLLRRMLLHPLPWRRNKAGNGYGL